MIPASGFGQVASQPVRVAHSGDLSEQDIRACTAIQARSTRSGACYFFFSGLLVTVAFDVVGHDASTAGDSSFLGCLGFLASRLPRS